MSNDAVIQMETAGAAPDPGAESITTEMYSKIDDIVARHQDTPGSLITVLRQVQEVCGYLPHSIQRYIAKGLNMSPSEVFGVATFYAFFSLLPRGKHLIRVCLGTACYVKRSQEIIDKLKDELGVELGEVTRDRKYSLEAVRCLGACGQAPVMVVGRETHGDVAVNTVIGIIKKYQ